MRFEVLGPLSVRTADGTAVAVPEAKVRALLADLLVHHGRPLPASRLLEDLWGAAKPGNPTNSLQTKVSQLRAALERAEPGARGLVAYTPSGYLLRVADDAVDAGRFTALVGRARSAPDAPSRAALLREALDLWRGPAFADFRDAEFTQGAIARLEEQRLTAQEDLAELRLELGETTALADELTALVHEHPLRERLRALQMRALHRAGRRGEALEAYHELRRHLAEELGIDPGAEITALHRSLLRETDALAPVASAPAPPGSASAGSSSGSSASGPAAAPAAPRARPRAGLPAQVTSLIGREENIAEVCGLVRSSRLVTLTGPGGVGKTRLAVATAERLGDDHDDGVRFVELAGAKGDVAETVAAALDVRDDASRDVHAGSPVDRLASALESRRMLLVLDNCEPVIEQVAALVEQVLRRAADVRVLATSQEPLGLTGETVYGVLPLPEAEAMKLFCARAAAAAPGFALDATTTESVALICRRLDGIPLALELAATRVRTLGIHVLADRLHDRFRLLNQVRRDGPARQRTLRAMIDWSWGLLTAPEQTLLRRLAVFSGGFTLEAAEAVCSGPAAGGGDVAAEDTLDQVSRLVDRSLIVVTHGTDGPRYRMFESVGAYSRERLAEAGESVDVRRRHARYFADLAERVDPLLRGREQRHWLFRLDQESANIHEALDHVVTDGAADVALRLVNALTWYWYLRGRIGEAVRTFDLVLARAEEATAPPGVSAAGLATLRDGARARRAAFTLLTGDASRLEESFDQADVHGRWFLAFARCGFRGHAHARELEGLTAEFRALGDRWGEAATLSTRATQAIYQGDYPALRRCAEESAAIFAELQDGWGQLQASEQLGVLAEIGGDYDVAARLHRDGVRFAEELQLWTHASFRLARMGRIALLTGDDARAAELHERARRLAAEQCHRPAEQFAETGLALGARRRGDFDAAEAHLRPWLEWNRRLGVDSGAALILAQLGYVAEQRGDLRSAESLHREGLAAARRTRDPRAVALAFEGLAGVHAAAGRPEEAASLLGKAAALRDSVGVPLPRAERGDVDRAEARAKEALGEARFKDLFDDGHAAVTNGQVPLWTRD